MKTEQALKLINIVNPVITGVTNIQLAIDRGEVINIEKSIRALCLSIKRLGEVQKEIIDNQKNSASPNMDDLFGFLKK